jgi:hypothetical protein
MRGRSKSEDSSLRRKHSGIITGSDLDSSESAAWLSAESGMRDGFFQPLGSGCGGERDQDRDEEYAVKDYQERPPPIQPMFT